MKNKPLLIAPPDPANDMPGLVAAVMFLGAAFKAEQGEKPSPQGDWDADHWRCSIASPFGRFSTDYWMGSGHRGRAPEIWGYLDCCQSDANAAAETSFESFCSDYGHASEDPSEIRESRRVYKACQKMDQRMGALLGAFQEPARREDYAGICREALALCQASEDYFDPSPKRGNGWGLLELAAFCAQPEALAAALGRDPSPERLAAALALCQEGPLSLDEQAAECEGALESFIAREELRQSVAPAKAHAAAKGI